MIPEELRKLIMKKYRDCMNDCQIPTGALAQLNPAEFFAYSMWENNKELRNDLVMLSVAIDQMENRMQKGLFNNAITIAIENRDIVNKYNPLRQPSNDEWLIIKNEDYEKLRSHLKKLYSRENCNVRHAEDSMQEILNTCFHELSDHK